MPISRLFTRATLNHGVVAGLVGAGAVALWYFIIDMVAGRPFFVPAALGSAMFLGARSLDAVSMSAGIILGYTIVHIAAFIAAGIIATAFVQHAESEPDALIGVVLLFVVVEVFSIGLIAIAAAWLLSEIRWWTVVIANLIAAVAMGVYLWKMHPGLRYQLSSDDREDTSLGTGI